MNTTERDTIAAKADMIVCGYAFLRTEDTFIHVVNLNAPFHALVMTQDRFLNLWVLLILHFSLHSRSYACTCK